MSETTQEERDWFRQKMADNDGMLCRAVRDADRLQRAEKLLRESAPHVAEGLEAEIYAFLGEPHD